MLNGDEWLSHDKEIAMIAIVLILVVAIAAIMVISWDEATSGMQMIRELVVNALVAIGSLATGRKIGRSEWQGQKE